MVKDNKVLKRKEKENKPKSIIVGIGSPSRRVGLWAMPEDEQKPEDGQWDCRAWVNGLKTKEENNGSTLIFKELGNLQRASGR